MAIIINSYALTYRRVGRLISSFNSTCRANTIDPETHNSAPKKPRTLEDILNEFGPSDQVQFDPFQPEAPRKARANLPHWFPSQPEPIDYLHLFLTDDLWQTITTNSNRYAAFQHRTNLKERHRAWKNMIPEELRVFVGALIYMGIHKEPQIKDYWNTDIHLGLLHTIPFHMSLRRFEQIKRFLHISDAEDDIRQGRDNSPEWWHKLKPLTSALQHSFMKWYTLSSIVSMDELMVRCFGRFIHTYKMLSKPI